MALTIDDIIADQASRYGLGVNEYLYGSSNSYTPGEFDANTPHEKGNPFFTQTNQPQMGRMNSNSLYRPFVWQGNNKSLRQTFQKGHQEYWDKYAKSSSSVQDDTWKGPQIRPEYQNYSNGLSQLGTPSYWQDNNKNQLFDSEMDDRIGGEFDQFSGQPGDIPMGMGEEGQNPMDDSWMIDQLYNDVVSGNNVT